MVKTYTWVTACLFSCCYRNVISILFHSWLCFSLPPVYWESPWPWWFGMNVHIHLITYDHFQISSHTHLVLLTKKKCCCKCHQWDFFTHFFLRFDSNIISFKKNYLKVYDSPAKINCSFLCGSMKFYFTKIMHRILPAFIKYVYVCSKVINLKELCFNIFLQSLWI